MPWPHCGLSLTSLADILEPSPHPDMLCFVEDPTFGYEDFTRRGAEAPPTFRAQVGPPGSSWYRSGFTNKQGLDGWSGWRVRHLLLQDSMRETEDPRS